MNSNLLKFEAQVKSAKVMLVDYPDAYINMAPAIEIEMEPGTHYRALNIVLHSLAAAVECASPADEYWTVDVEWLSDEHGVVYLQLDDESAPAVAGALALLRTVWACVDAFGQAKPLPDAAPYRWS